MPTSQALAMQPEPTWRFFSVLKPSAMGFDGFQINVLIFPRLEMFRLHFRLRKTEFGRTMEVPS
jgi:hypothetical protein